MRKQDGPYVGWLRQGRHSWRPVCEGESEAACWRALARTPRAGACELTVLRRGEDANTILKEARRPRRRIAVTEDNSPKNRARIALDASGCAEVTRGPP